MSNHYQQILSGQLAADLSDHAKWRFTGSDRVRYLNGQTTCDVATLKNNRSRWGAAVNIKGRLDGDIRISSLPDFLLADADSSLQASLGLRLGKYMIADDVEMEGITDSWKLFHILQPHESIPLPFDCPAGTLIFFSNRFGLPGLDLWMPASEKTNIPCGSTGDWEALRIGNSIPRWGIDMGPDNLAPEMPFERFEGLSYTKGCYIGQEVIARIKSIGHVNRHLCSLGSETSTLPSLPSPCLVDGKNVGTLTSAVLSPDSAGGLALATLHRAFTASGTRIEAGGTAWVVRPGSV